MKAGDLVRLRGPGGRWPILVLRELMTQGYPEFECLHKGQAVRYWAEMLESVNEKNP